MGVVKNLNITLIVSYHVVQNASPLFILRKYVTNIRIQNLPCCSVKFRVGFDVLLLFSAKLARYTIHKRPLFTIYLLKGVAWLAESKLTDGLSPTFVGGIVIVKSNLWCRSFVACCLIRHSHVGVPKLGADSLLVFLTGGGDPWGGPRLRASATKWPM